jgi:hypothetical protein
MKGNFLPYGLGICETTSQNGMLARKVIRAVFFIKNPMEW